MRLVTTVKRIPEVEQVGHYVGYPPALTGGIDKRQELPFPDLLLIRPEGKKANVLLWRYKWDGQFIGDTWHLTRDDALEEAERAYTKEALGEWIEIPEEVPDTKEAMLAFARNVLGENA